MAVSYEVYLQAERMPDAGWVESATRGMEPSFAFAGAYDLVTDSGWCPCRLGATDCGFEWALEPAHDVPAGIAAAGFDRVAQLSFRSSDADAICAVLVAGNLAMIAGGTIVTPDEERVPADDVLAWASAQVRHLKKGPKGRRRNEVRDKRAPAELLRDWLIDLTAAAATVHGVVRSTPDDPLVAIKFSQIGELDHAFDRLVTTLRSGPLTAATYDPAGFELQFVFPGGTFAAYPLCQSNGVSRETTLTWTERWELQHEGQRIYADIDERTLIAGPF